MDLKKDKKNGKTDLGYINFKGQRIPVLKADSVEKISNLRTGQVYKNMDEFLTDVANPNTATTQQDLRKDLTVEVMPIKLTGITNN